MNRKANENTPNPCRSVNKAVIILSGVSGSGKSFVADLLAESFSELTYEKYNLSKYKYFSKRF